MTREMRRFLTARFLTMLAWALLFGAGMVVGTFIGDRIDNAALGWVVNCGTLFGSIKLGLLLQNRVLVRIDPDGRLRAQLAKLGTDAEDE